MPSTSPRRSESLLTQATGICGVGHAHADGGRRDDDRHVRGGLARQADGVALGQLRRALGRGIEQVAVAGWIEDKAGARVEDLAEILAHHYATALELARAAGETGLADAVAGPAVRYLELAGDRARPLDVAAAESLYARALENAARDSARRSALLLEWAKVAIQLGRGAEAVNPLEERSPA